jgi:hypothetical protein
MLAGRTKELDTGLAFRPEIRERKNARGAGRTKEWTREADEKLGSDLRSIALAAVSSGMFFEQIELAWDGAGCWCDGLVVTAYLGEVGRLELQGEFHQGVCDVSGGFVGDGVFG